MEGYNDVSFNVVPNDEECVVNAVQIGKRIDEPPHTIRSWADAFQDFLYIKKINGRWQYTEKSVSQFQIIKSLRRDKDVSISQIKELIQNNGFQNLQNNTSSEVINRDTFDIQYITTVLTEENKRQMTAFMSAIIQQQNQFKETLLEELKSETAITVQETIESSVVELQNILNSALEKQDSKTDMMLNKLEAKEQMDTELVSNLRELMKIRKEEAQQQVKQEFEKKNKGFFSRFITKKNNK